MARTLDLEWMIIEAWTAVSKARIEGKDYVMQDATWWSFA